MFRSSAWDYIPFNVLPRTDPAGGSLWVQLRSTDGQADNNDDDE